MFAFVVQYNLIQILKVNFPHRFLGLSILKSFLLYFRYILKVCLIIIEAFLLLALRFNLWISRVDGTHYFQKILLFLFHLETTLSQFHVKPHEPSDLHIYFHLSIPLFHIPIFHLNDNFLNTYYQIPIKILHSHAFYQAHNIHHIDYEHFY